MRIVSQPEPALKYFPFTCKRCKAVLEAAPYDVRERHHNSFEVVCSCCHQAHHFEKLDWKNRGDNLIMWNGFEHAAEDKP